MKMPSITAFAMVLAASAASAAQVNSFDGAAVLEHYSTAHSIGTKPNPKPEDRAR